MFGHDDHDDDNKEDVTVEPTAPAVSDDTDTSAAAPTEPTLPAPTPVTTEDSSSEEAPAASSGDPDLLALKKQALEELSPLVAHLDQTPEEKFKTTMMLIQATDSSNLIKEAHEAALAISDEKVRAQALLDIVNEINYFTQK